MLDKNIATIFAGPSIYGMSHSELIGFDLKGPVVCGDLVRAICGGAKVIGIIDGIFENCRSVWHKEILYAIANGVTVYGAASMGALRAAECAPFGMIGVGEVFRSYQSGSRVADADVAVSHGPAELHYMPLTVALVDVEAALQQARAMSRITVEVAEAMLFIARHLHFSERTWEKITERASVKHFSTAENESVAQKFQPGVKYRDAKVMLEKIRDDDRKGIVQNSPTWTFQYSAFFRDLEEAVK